MYLRGDRADEKVHQRHHKAWCEAVDTLGYEPEQYNEREARKARGYARLADADSAEQHAGAMDLVRAWFDRSLADAIENGYWKQHPLSDRYAAMLDLEKHFRAPVAAQVRARVGSRVPGVEDGHTNWCPRP
jgi:hypothetical protein